MHLQAGLAQAQHNPKKLQPKSTKQIVPINFGYIEPEFEKQKYYAQGVNYINQANLLQRCLARK